VAADKPNEKKKNINGGGNGGTDENKNGGIKKEIRGSTDEKTDGKSLLK